MHKSNKKGFTLVEIMIVVVIIGLLAAMAIPAFQKVRASSQEKAIVNNLRQLASAAQQYMLEEGVVSVDTASLVGEGKHISVLTKVAGEAYPSEIKQSSSEITATGGAPGTVTYTF
jgi:type IV pilus assembly protein PilA